ncbi:MAG: hypothetical protein J5822_01135 [Eubacteriaceae bacterium]|nr:hypothetical protein [Eubacteriaceae bacterium]
MKKIAIAAALISIICLLGGCGRSTQTDYTAMDFYSEELGVAFDVPEGYTVDSSDPDGYVFICENGRAVPYMMFKKYDFAGGIDDFKAQIKKSVADTFGSSFKGEQHNNIGGKKVLVLKFSYQLDGYTISDARCIYEKGGTYYVFTTKEASDLGHNLNAELDFVMKSFIIIE